MLLAGFLFFALSSTALSFTTPFRGPNSVHGLSARDSGNCPDVWSDIAKELTKKFLGDGECNQDARRAIRLSFHDCASWSKAHGSSGGCDASLILSGEMSRSENKGLEDIGEYIKDLATKHNVSKADAIVFAGSHATVTCPGGPQVQTWIGRTDSSTPSPEGLLPDVNAAANDLIKLFKDKGFNEHDLAALLGAHSTSNQFNTNTSSADVGLPQDTTPGVWDVKYYSETLKPVKGIFVLASDAKLAADPTMHTEFQGFADSQRSWTGAYADAMGRMILSGKDNTDGMVDCTGALPSSTNAKREMRGMPLFAPRR